VQQGHKPADTTAPAEQCIPATEWVAAVELVLLQSRANKHLLAATAAAAMSCQSCYTHCASTVVLQA
jgi:hypothetical protein